MNKKAYRNFLDQRSFTLIELMVVVIIVSVIAGFAVPSFTKTMERQLEKNAFLKIRLLHGAMMIYKSRQNQYPINGAALNDIGVINSTLKINMVEDPFDVSCDADGTSYWCCATAHSADAMHEWRICYQPNPPLDAARPNSVFYCNNFGGAGPCPTCAYAGCGSM